jgi:hypothetical protein
MAPVALATGDFFWTESTTSRLIIAVGFGRNFLFKSLFLKSLRRFSLSGFGHVS